VAGGKLIREAAALAESSGVDRIAVRAWTQLALSASVEEHDPRRGLEYLAYAEAALNRHGRAPAEEVQVLYAKGGALVELGRTKEAEAAFAAGLELALGHEPSMVYVFVFGLGYVQETEAHYADAVATYRRASAAFARSATTVVASHEINLRTRLAASLLMLGRPAEAEPEARRAVELGDLYLTPDSVDRALTPILVAEVLHDEGRYPEALDVARRAKAELARVAGAQSRAYAHATRVEANITRSMGDTRAALAGIDEACALLPLTSGDAVKEGVECVLDKSDALLALGRQAAALALLTRTEPTALEAYSSASAPVGRLYALIGLASLALGKHADAIARLEQAVAVFDSAQIDPGRVAPTRFALARALWPGNRTRARQLAAEAADLLDAAAPRWASAHRDVAAWLAAHPAAD
jgi:tetratricopeptide (TPR) repeat protein